MTEDTRDLRDPQKLGEWILKARERYAPGTPFHAIAARTDLQDVDSYTGGPYMSAPPEQHHMYGFDFNNLDPSGD